MSIEKRRRVTFGAAVLLAFTAILIFNIFTPYMTDDLSYKTTVLEADSFLDLIKQEYEQYMTWTGRSVGHMILRLFLGGSKAVFNIFNSLIFTLLTLLIYWNIEHKKRYDATLFILVNLLLCFLVSCSVRRFFGKLGHAITFGELQLSCSMLRCTDG